MRQVCSIACSRAHTVQSKIRNNLRAVKGEEDY